MSSCSNTVAIRDNALLNSREYSSKLVELSEVNLVLVSFCGNTVLKRATLTTSSEIILKKGVQLTSINYVSWWCYFWAFVWKLTFSSCRLYGSSGACAACSELIPAAEMVMKIKDKAYHMRCFTCCACHQRLVTGDRIHFINDRIFCESDYPLALRSMATTPTQQQQTVSGLKTYRGMFSFIFDNMIESWLDNAGMVIVIFVKGKN